MSGPGRSFSIGEESQSRGPLTASGPLHRYAVERRQMSVLHGTQPAVKVEELVLFGVTTSHIKLEDTRILGLPKKSLVRCIQRRL